MLNINSERGQEARRLGTKRLRERRREQERERENAENAVTGSTDM
jgi:hypothetical protein